MASAIANCECEVCGKEFYKEVWAKGCRNCEEKKEWAESFFTVCPECEKKQQEEARAKRIQAAIDAGLPPLEGTEKQVKWASDIRDEWVDWLSNELDGYRIETQSGMDGKDKTPDYLKHLRFANDIAPYLMDFVKTKVKASWWIDNRDKYGSYMLRALETWVMEEMKTPEELKEAEAKANALTVKPVNLKHEGIVEITVDEKNAKVSAEYIKDDTFINTVKGLGYLWRESTWMKYFFFVDSLVDREAELGNILLQKGFAVRFSSQEAKEKAISGEYSDEIKRCVVENGGRFRLFWEYGNDKLYEGARSLRTAKWEKGSMFVKSSAYLEVEDFARVNGFALSPGAKKLIEEERNKLVKVEAVSVKAKARKNTEEAKLDEILNSSREVLADLVEDED